MHGFTLEVGSKGTLAIWTVKKSPVSVCAECTRKNADVAKDALLGSEHIRDFGIDVIM